jgi:hypothetical protein
MSFEQLLEISRNNIQECLKTPIENFRIQNRYTYNPTNFEDHMLHPWSKPFISQIYYLNHYVFTTASTNEPWDKGGLHKENGMSIYFYIKNKDLKPLEEFCIYNKLLVTLVNYNELEQISENNNIDFRPLYNETTHIEVYDPDQNSHNLYLKLINFFNDYTKDLLYSLDEDIDINESWYFKNNFYQILEKEILDDETIKYNMILLEKLKEYVKVFYHPIYINYSAFRLGVSKEILEKLKKMTTHKIDFIEWKPEEKCEYHINLIIDWENDINFFINSENKKYIRSYTCLEVLSQLLKIIN